MIKSRTKTTNLLTSVISEKSLSSQNSWIPLIRKVVCIGLHSVLDIDLVENHSLLGLYELKGEYSQTEVGMMTRKMKD